MRTSAPGNKRARAPHAVDRGFTLLELLVVVAIIAFATAGVSFALRDSASARLDREGLRLAALLESAREQSRTSGVPVRWRPRPEGFRFEGLTGKPLPEEWLAPGTHVAGTPTLVLGPEPIIGAQSVVLSSTEVPDRTLRVATDGIRPFAIDDGATP